MTSNFFAYLFNRFSEISHPKILQSEEENAMRALLFSYFSYTPPEPKNLSQSKQLKKSPKQFRVLNPGGSFKPTIQIHTNHTRVPDI